MEMCEGIQAIDSRFQENFNEGAFYTRSIMEFSYEIKTVKVQLTSIMEKLRCCSKIHL
jgi:hypothetical protein